MSNTQRIEQMESQIFAINALPNRQKWVAILTQLHDICGRFAEVELSAK